MAIIEQEKKDILRSVDDTLIQDLSTYLIENQEKFTTEQSHFYKNIVTRYKSVADFFSERYKIDFSLYISSASEKKSAKQAETNGNHIPSVSEAVEKLSSMRLNKPDAENTTIEDIINLMKKRRFMIRPPYQREEVINRLKSSAIIESILLDIKLPPIFLFKRSNGVVEVVDGQQRLLSILGYIGEEYLSENSDFVKSEKHNFPLSKLKILEELNGKKFSQLSEEQRDKIFTFNLYVVNIDSKSNPDFDPIDLFLRLNNKPYPIKENSFEMWNSYVDRGIISNIKDLNAKYSKWFYYRVKSNRMENEELITSLAFLAGKKRRTSRGEDPFALLDFYQRGTKINIRIKQKVDITNYLNACSESQEEKKACDEHVKEVDSFIRKVQMMLIDKNLMSEEEKTDYLEKELSQIFGLTGSNYSRRRAQWLYALWFILSNVSLEMIKQRRALIKYDISNILSYFRNPVIAENNEEILDVLKNMIRSFWGKYSTTARNITLSQGEKQQLILDQGNQCPLCKGVLYVGDDIHIDHRIPLSLKGPDGIENLQATHSDCNLIKGARIASPA